MKSKIFKLSTVVLLFLFLGAGCQKDEIEYADESIEVSSWPFLSVYKTKGDYFNNIAVQLTADKRVNAIPTYTLSDEGTLFDKEGIMRVDGRFRLKHGYILDCISYINYVFTDISLQEYVDWNTANKLAGWPGNSIKRRIIDEDPFIEFYHFDGVYKPERIFTLGEINNMVKNGTLETFFTKLK